MLCHDVGGLKEQITHGKEGFFVEINNISDWIEKISLLYKNTSLYKTLSKNAYEKSKQFSLTNSIHQFETIYTNTIDQTPPHANG